MDTKLKLGTKVTFSTMLERTTEQTKEGFNRVWKRVALEKEITGFIIGKRVKSDTFVFGKPEGGEANTASHFEVRGRQEVWLIVTTLGQTPIVVPIDEPKYVDSILSYKEARTVEKLLEQGNEKQKETLSRFIKAK